MLRKYTAGFLALLLLAGAAYAWFSYQALARENLALKTEADRAKLEAIGLQAALALKPKTRPRTRPAKRW